MENFVKRYDTNHFKHFTPKKILSRFYYFTTTLRSSISLQQSHLFARINSGMHNYMNWEKLML